jgi:hypothetical protein
MDLTWVYICLYGFPISLVAIAAIIAAWIIWERYFTPEESKIIRKASRKKKALDFLASDDGYGDFVMNEKTGKGGYAETTRDPKSNWTGFYARSSEETDGEDTKTKIANLINKFASRKLYLRHAKIPIWFGYAGKAILASLYSLIALDITEQLATNGGNPTKPQPQPIDVTAIKSLFSKPWDQSQIRAQSIDAKREGMLEEKKFSGLQSWKALVVPVGIILALIMGVIVLSVVFL